MELLVIVCLHLKVRDFFTLEVVNSSYEQRLQSRISMNYENASATDQKYLSTRQREGQRSIRLMIT
jgi:hypothetical protein